MDVVEIIQAMLAPAIMISACGLLLLGMNNKYSLVVSRIRILDEEKRKYDLAELEHHLKPNEQYRLENISRQIEMFFVRIRRIRNAVLSYSIAVAFFILTSLVIGIKSVSDADLAVLAIAFFLFGMICVFSGIFYAAREVLMGYKIIKLEVKGI